MLAVGLALSWVLSFDSHGQVAGPPLIVTQPVDQTAPSGGVAAFTVVVAPSQTPLGYQWRFNGTNISGATDGAYTISNVQYTNEGTYNVRVSNAAGSTNSSNARLTVINTPLHFVSAGWATNGFKTRLEGPVASQYVLLTSTNLRDWIPIATNAATTGSADFIDPRGTNGMRFYRGKVQ